MLSQEINDSNKYCSFLGHGKDIFSKCQQEKMFVHFIEKVKTTYSKLTRWRSIALNLFCHFDVWILLKVVKQILTVDKKCISARTLCTKICHIFQPLLQHCWVKQVSLKNVFKSANFPKYFRYKLTIISLLYTISIHKMVYRKVLLLNCYYLLLESFSHFADGCPLVFEWQQVSSSLQDSSQYSSRSQ